MEDSLVFVLLKSLAYAHMPSIKPAYTAQPTARYATEYEGTSNNYPERRLWVSVILYTITEYEAHLRAAAQIWKTRRMPGRQAQLTIRNIRYEVLHDWFRHVCDLAGFEQTDVVRKIRALETQYGFAEIQFSGADGPTRYAVRKARTVCRK